MLGSKCSLSLSWPAKARQTAFFHSARFYHALHQHHQKPIARKSSIQSVYVDTNAPAPNELLAAQNFFETHLPSKSWTATEWRQQPHSDLSHLTPEVVFLGRSNSGKSSLLNAITNDSQLCRVGPTPGKTTTMHAWSLSPADPTTKGARKGYGGDVQSKLTVLDMPGYGHGSHNDWGQDILKYLTSRRQLRRAFVLVNPAHGLKKGDLQMMNLLRSHGISHQFIACKCDHEAIADLPSSLHTLQREIQARSSNNSAPLLLTVTDLLAVGGLGDGRANHGVKTKKMHGLGDVRWAILRAAGLDAYALSLLAGSSAVSVPSPSSILLQYPRRSQDALLSLAERGEVTLPTDTTTQSRPEPGHPGPFTPQAEAKPRLAETTKSNPTRPSLTLTSAPVSESQTMGIGMDALLSMTSPTAHEQDNRKAGGHQTFRSRRRRSIRR